MRNDVMIWWSSMIFVAAIWGLGLGCINAGSYHTAQPVETGETEITVALEGTASTSDDVSGVNIGQPRLNIRRGLNANTDLGFTAGNFGTGFDLNFMYVDTGALALSVNPYVGVFGARALFTDDDEPRDDVLLNTSYLGLLTDINVDDGLAVTLGAKPGLVNTFVWSGGAGGTEVNRERETWFMVGGSVGAKIDLDGMHLFPEVNVIWLDNDDNDAGEFGLGEDGLLVVVGVGFGF